MNIRYVEGFRTRNGSLGDTVAGTDDQIERTEIEALDGFRHDWKVVSIAA
jgi:hypothetical protein